LLHFDNPLPARAGLLGQVSLIHPELGSALPDKGPQIGLILRTLKSLEISIDLDSDSSVETPSQGKAKAPDINSVLDSLKKRPQKKQI
jgi:hypothetical protein